MALFSDIGTVFAMALIGIVFALPVMIVPRLFAPHRPNPLKNAPFEAGQTPTGKGKMHFMMQYYAYLLMFVVFDVMAMFLYAWAVAFQPLQLGLYSSWVITLFVGALIVPLGFALYMAGRRELW